MKGCYPVIIRHDECDKVFYADIPDFGEDGENFTYGNDIPDALYMVWDALNLFMLNFQSPPPPPSQPAQITAKDGEILSWVWYDTEQYKIFLQALKQKTA